MTITVNAPRKEGTITLTSISSYAGDDNAANNSEFEETLVQRPARPTPFERPKL